MYRLMASVGVAAVLALAAPVMAQAPAAPSTAGPVTLIQAGRLLDRPGQAPRGPSTVVVRDGLIVEIRDGFVDAAAFPGATVIDQRDRFVLPGLIDSHVHLVSDLGGQAGFLSGVTENLPATPIARRRTPRRR